MISNAHLLIVSEEFLWRELKLSKRHSKTKCFKKLSIFSDAHGHLTSLESCNNFRDSLAIIDKCLMFADGVVIPTKLWRAVLKQLHSGHPGINRMKTIALYTRLTLILTLKRQSRVVSLALKQQKNPPRIMDSHRTYPKQSWSRLHVDFACPTNEQFSGSCGCPFQLARDFSNGKYGHSLNY